MNIPTTRLGGVPVSRLGFDGTMAVLDRALQGEGALRVATANLDFLRLASSNQDLMHCLTTADLVAADGMPLVWLSRLGGEAIEERVAGVDLVHALLERSGGNETRVFLLGGAAGAAEAVAESYGRRHPSLTVAGCYGGRVDLHDPDSCTAAVEAVRAARADLVLVALGCPKQEIFLERHFDELDCRVAIGVGGSFEMLSGMKKRAPRFVRRLCLEWAWRCAQEPRRLFKRYVLDGAFMARLMWGGIRGSSAR